MTLVNRHVINTVNAIWAIDSQPFHFRGLT